jgi:CDGSH-type Zn-finger protein
MEYFIGLIILAGIGYYVYSKYATPAVKEEIKEEVAKVEEAVKCGCGRSPTGFCVGLHALSDAEWNKMQATEAKVATKVKTVAAKTKATATKVEAAAKTAEAKVEKAAKTVRTKKTKV